ncbi:hypothetical protein ACFFMN_26700 [Planobispora siamensis]|uniref:Uncharacterized protein n=1 Tax=Planobispora siamensis TaxID=936338 RepID=A0A8J3SB10_9ACTN|nr:hypothetical protein [Planobispora siamensis]GIH90743.1 hypothetical protein Psi01_13730 [Planobispora siamensis]
MFEASVGAAAVAVAALVGGSVFGADPVTGGTVAVGVSPRQDGPAEGPAGPSGAGGGVPEASGDTVSEASGGAAPTGGATGGEERREGQSAQESKASGPSRHTDAKAVAYFQRNKAAKRIKDIRTVGGYLRIYTDMPESADNSEQALELCETGREYLEGLGVENPVIFVQAEFGENGNPILANVLGPDDSTCQVTHPEPGD